MVYGLYIASVIGAVALFMMMPRLRYAPRTLGKLLGAATVGGAWLYLARVLPAAAEGSAAPRLYYYVFSAIAIGAAARVITHEKPVFSALWFILVVLASAGLLLALDAEFMAMAMVIIYGGAILVTYVFVIMLATQSVDPNNAETAPVYDRAAREPLAAVGVGFLLLALLLTVVCEPVERRAAHGAAAHDDVVDRLLARRPAVAFAEQLGQSVDKATAQRLAGANQLTNTEAIGLDLFRRHPLGLELAGVILLVALIGAVVIARMPVPEANLPDGDPSEP